MPKFHSTAPIVRYTNNAGHIISPDGLDEAGRTCRDLALSFSHFSHVVTKETVLVCDLEGIATTNKKKEKVLFLTDPAIHCPSQQLRFGGTNLGNSGIQMFFGSHICNRFCLALGLPKTDNSTK